MQQLLQHQCPLLTPYSYDAGANTLLSRAVPCRAVSCCAVLCCAVLCCAVLCCVQAIEADGMLDNATQRGAQLMKGLVKLAER
jgi:hypothetical protein